MISFNEIFAQSALGLNPVNSLDDISFSSINSFEFNPSNFSVIKDWAFAFTFGGEITKNDFRSNLYQVSAGKKIKDHYLQLRYSPGFQKEFVVKSDQQVVYGSENESTLETRYLYKELFAAGYSFDINDHFTAGISLRYFKEEFSKDLVTTIFSDTVYFIPETEQSTFNNWKFDLGVTWRLSKQLKLSLGSVNLINATENSDQNEYHNLRLKQKKEILAGVSFSPINELNLNFTYESSSAFVLGLSTLHNIGSVEVGISVSGFHDKIQNPYFAGAKLSGMLITKHFDISLTWLNYFSDRSLSYNLTDFKEQKIASIVNNQYSNDKVLLNAVFKLNTLTEKKLKFLDVEIKNNLYPALSDIYLDQPFAKAKVTNLTNEKVDANPFVQIKDFGNEKIFSPAVSLSPFDTVEVFYFLVIPENYSSVNPEITYANFSVSTSNEFIDDQIQKPLIINSINAWDGKVMNLKYFINKDLDFSVKYSKNILTGYKYLLDSTRSSLLTFQKAKIIFNEFVKKLTYISDPRASAEYVQYPKQTLELKGGDCDDLSVSYSSFLEAIGIETALIDYKPDNSIRHVSVMFNTKLNPEQGYLLGANDTKYFLRKNDAGDDEIWIPVETTTLTNFDEAWSIGSTKFNKEAISDFGLLNGKVEIIDIY